VASEPEFVPDEHVSSDGAIASAVVSVKRAKPPSLITRAGLAVFRTALFPFAKIVGTGIENLPREGGFIAAANHVSELDSLTTPEFLLVNGFIPRVLAKQALFKTPVVGAFLRQAQMIPVDRGSEKAASSLAVAEEELTTGACVLIFPEGTLTRDPDLWPMEGKTGVARLALATRVPVIPIGQWGPSLLLPRYGRIPKLGKRKEIKIAVGKPVDLSDLYDRPIDGDVLREATDRVMDAITALVEQVRGEKAPAQRFDLRLHPEYKKKQTVYPPVQRP